MFKAIGKFFSKRTDGHQRLSEPGDDKAVNGPRETESIDAVMNAEREGAEKTVSAMDEKAAEAADFKKRLGDHGFI